MKYYTTDWTGFNLHKLLNKQQAVFKNMSGLEMKMAFFFFPAFFPFFEISSSFYSLIFQCKYRKQNIGLSIEFSKKMTKNKQNILGLKARRH